MHLPLRFAVGLCLAAVATQGPSKSAPAPKDPRERHLANIRQLTFGGENAEAYFSDDGTRLIFQSTRDGYPCDQIYTMKIDGTDLRRVSTGTGRTTCGYYRYPQGDRIVYATTEGGAAECPPKPDMSKGYVWPVYPSFDIVEANLDECILCALCIDAAPQGTVTVHKLYSNEVLGVPA